MYFVDKYTSNVVGSSGLTTSIIYTSLADLMVLSNANGGLIRVLLEKFQNKQIK